MATIDWSSGRPRILKQGVQWRGASDDPWNPSQAGYYRQGTDEWGNPTAAWNFLGRTADPGEYHGVEGIPMNDPFNDATWRDLQAAGLWSGIGDRNSALWQQYQAANPMYGQGAVDAAFANENAWAKSVLPYITDPNDYAAAFQGQNLTPQQIGGLQGTITANQQAAQDRDFGDTLTGMINPLTVGLALFGGVGAFGAGAGAGAGAGSASSGGTAAAAGGSMMPPAIPAVDPTFGGALAQVSPGVWAAPGAAGLGTAAAAAAAPYGGFDAGAIEAASQSGGLYPAASGGAAAASGIGSIMDKVMSSPQLMGSLAGAALGGLGGGSKPAGTITVEEGIPDWLQPYVKPQLDKYSSMVQNYQVDPYGVMPSAMQEFKNTVSGTYLDPSTNKWLEQYFNLGAERVKGALSPTFGHMQAFGQHSGYNEALSRGLGDLAVGLYGGNYQKERDRQYGAMGAAPSFLAGGTQATFSPYNSYLQTVGSLGKKKEEPYFNNAFGNILGGAMTGYGLGNIFK